MVKKYISNDMYFTLDQLIESAKLFVFILLAPKLLSAESAVIVISLNSGAFLLQLVLSSYLTQHLMVSYNNESRGEWFVLFLKLSMPLFFALYLFGETNLSLMFISLLVSEYFKRVMYYSDSSFISLLSNFVSFVLFILLVVLTPNLTPDEYFLIYFICSLIYLSILIGSNWKDFFSRSREKIEVNLKLFNFGNKVVVSLAIYWAISQGVYYFSEYFNLSNQDVIDLKMTQTVFGLSAIFAAIFETILLKRMGGSNSSAITKKIIWFFPSVVGICLFNLILLFIVSKFFYYIEISMFTMYILLFQLVFIINRIPCAYLKKHNLIGRIAFSYLVGFVFGLVLNESLLNLYEPRLLVSFCMFSAHFLSSLIMYLSVFFNREKENCIIT